MKANSAKVHYLWAESDPLLRDYHDKEWGVPQYDSRALWELLMLARLQSSIATDLPDKPPGQRSAYVRYDYCCNMEAQPTIPSTVRPLTMKNSEMNSLITAILEGDCGESVLQVEQLRAGGVTSQHIVMHGIEPAMLALDSKCTLEQFNLLEIMLAGRAVTEVMKLLYPAGSTMAVTKATVVIASLEGDVHDLGKNILKMVLSGSRYRVVDCGKDCPLPKLMETVEKEQPLAIGISGLITHIIPLVRQVKDLLRLRGLERVKVMAGGAALKQSSPDRLNVDFVAESAFDSLHYLEALAGDGQ